MIQRRRADRRTVRAVVDPAESSRAARSAFAFAASPATSSTRRITSSAIRRSTIRSPSSRAGAAALILDAHFTPDELPQHSGWGHSTWRQCAEFAARVDAGGLWLFHHKPGRTDEALVRIRHDAQRIFRATETASEGEALQLLGRLTNNAVRSRS